MGHAVDRHSAGPWTHARVCSAAPHLGVAREREVLAKGMPGEAVVRQDAAQVGVAREAYAKHVVGLALCPQCGGENGSDARDGADLVCGGGRRTRRGRERGAGGTPECVPPGAHSPASVLTQMRCELKVERRWTTTSKRRSRCGQSTPVMSMKVRNCRLASSRRAVRKAGNISGDLTSAVTSPSLVTWARRRGWGMMHKLAAPRSTRKPALESVESEESQNRVA